jgi:hypothetical protein
MSPLCESQATPRLTAAQTTAVRPSDARMKALLLCCPDGRGMSRDVELKNTTTVMSQNDKDEQNLEPNRWDSEESTEASLPKLKLVLDMPLS